MCWKCANQMQERPPMVAAFPAFWGRIFTLERSGNSQTEGLPRFAQLIARAVALNCFRVRIVSCAARWEHLARDEVLAIFLLLKTQGIERVVDTDRGIDDRHDHLQLGSGRHA